MRFLIDAQLPPALARFLTDAGHQAEHLEDVGLHHAKDNEVWTYALEHQAIIISKDEDFVDRFRRRGIGPVIVWLRIGNASKQVLLSWFASVLPAIIVRIEAGDKLIEVR